MRSPITIAASSGSGVLVCGDALPVPVAAYHRAQAAAVRRVASAVRDAAIVLHRVPLGATAVGTGLGAPVGYRELAVELANRTALPLLPAVDLFDALATWIRSCRWPERPLPPRSPSPSSRLIFASSRLGPLARCRGALAAVQVGSSMMPGKVEPGDS